MGLHGTAGIYKFWIIVCQSPDKLCERRGTKTVRRAQKQYFAKNAEAVLREGRENNQNAEITERGNNTCLTTCDKV